MGTLRIRKRVRLLSGVYLNFSKTGISPATALFLNRLTWLAILIAIVAMATAAIWLAVK